MARDRILVLFNNIEDSHLKQTLIKQIFRVDYSSSILKGLCWKTKYYEVTYDVYIDECDSFTEWLKEFSHPRYEELREVLAGVLIVDCNNKSLGEELIQELERLSSHILAEETFCVFFNHNEELSDSELDKFEDLAIELASSGKVIPEIVCLRSSSEGERVGVERIKEIIDIYPWSGIKHDLGTGIVQPHYDRDATEINTLMKQLDSAKLQVQRLNEGGDIEAAEQFAREIANKFAEQLFS